MSLVSEASFFVIKIILTCVGERIQTMSTCIALFLGNTSPGVIYFLCKECVTSGFFVNGKETV